jgi:hypothetical protein
MLNVDVDDLEVAMSRICSTCDDRLTSHGPLFSSGPLRFRHKNRLDLQKFTTFMISNGLPHQLRLSATGVMLHSCSACLVSGAISLDPKEESLA